MTTKSIRFSEKSIVVVLSIPIVTDSDGESSFDIAVGSSKSQ